VDGTIDDGPADGAAGGGALVVSGEDEVGPDVAVEAVDAVAPEVGGATAGFPVGRQEADGVLKGAAGRRVEQEGGAVGPLERPGAAARRRRSRASRG